MPGGNCFIVACASAITSAIAPSTLACGCKYTFTTETPYSDCDSICSMLSTVVVSARSYTDVMRSPISEGARPL